MADTLYQAMGANVPKYRLVEKNGKPIKIAEFVEGTLLSELKGKPLDAAYKELQKHFAADVLLRSWDVTGLGNDNIIVDKAGKVWRIDNGGSLGFRAQGAPKPPSDQLGELWTLRDPKINATTAKAFASLDYDTVMKQLRAQVNNRGMIVGSIDDLPTRAMLSRRFDEAAHLVKTYFAMTEDKFIPEYGEKINKAQTWIRSEGILNTASKELRFNGNPNKPGPDKFDLVDENGKPFDDLRGTNGIYSKFLKALDRYVTHPASDPASKLIKKWTAQQADNSWEAIPRLIKTEVLAKYRPSDYWEKPLTWDLAKRLYEQERKSFLESDGYKHIVDDTLASLHAFTYETLQKINVGNRVNADTLRLVRLETPDVAEAFGLDRVGVEKIYQRGPLESASIMGIWERHESWITAQEVPMHRIIGFYGLGVEKTMFLNNGENEVMAILDGIKVKSMGYTNDDPKPFSAWSVSYRP